MLALLFLGPGSSIWYTMHEKYVPAYRKLVQDLHGVDIHKQLGLWFGDIETCIKNGLKVQYYVQEPGDIVSFFFFKKPFILFSNIFIVKNEAKSFTYILKYLSIFFLLLTIFCRLFWVQDVFIG